MDFLLLEKEKKKTSKDCTFSGMKEEKKKKTPKELNAISKTTAELCYGQIFEPAAFHFS